MRTDWNAARREPQFVEDPARGTCSPLWGAAVPEWGRSGFLVVSQGERPGNAKGGERTWTASFGMVAALQAGAELRASFLAIGEPFGAAFCAAGGLGGGEVSLGGAV